MNIVVCLHAPHPGDGSLGRDDRHALAHALQLGPSHTVTALLAGSAADEGPLASALAAGVTRAVRLAGDDFGSADFHTLGQALATGIKRLGADLVLAGARSDDDGLGAVPASTARHLGFMHVACIETLAPGEGDAVEVTVRGGGRRRRLRVPLPAVLSVAAGPAELPAPPLTTGSGAAAVEVLSMVDPEATVVRRRTELLGQPELATRGTQQASTADELVDALVRAGG
jgi:electron transfer flavoprotein alpha/beta subunit